MQKAVGTAIGLILVRLVLPGIFGPAFMAWFAIALCALMLFGLLLWLRDRVRMRRFRRKVCDDAIFYARKKRRAFGEPDYAPHELSAIEAQRRRGDHQAVYRLLRAADQRLADSVRAKADAATAAEDRSRQRDRDIQMYRA